MRKYSLLNVKAHFSSSILVKPTTAMADARILLLMDATARCTKCYAWATRYGWRRTSIGREQANAMMATLPTAIPMAAYTLYRNLQAPPIQKPTPVVYR